jgi:HD-GYP domain-containing protein (c-di-GMP phosphodiesterase class II)
MLREAKVDDDLWLDCVLAHHEKVNGQGYPNQLKGSEYPEATQIIVLADQYCARLSPRAYRQPLLHKGILRDILLDKGETVNEEIEAFFIKELGFYPPGLIVKLNNGDIGIVRERGKRANTPVVQVCVRPRSGKLMIPIRQDTSTDTFKVKQLLLSDDPEVVFDARTVWGG